MKKQKSKKLHKPIFVWDKTFRVNYYISYGVSLKDFIESAKKYFCDPEVVDEPECDGLKLQFTLKGKKVIWIWTRRKDISVLYHECGHAILDTLRSRNVTINEESEEVLLYQIDMLVRMGQGKKF